MSAGAVDSNFGIEHRGDSNAQLHSSADMAHQPQAQYRFTNDELRVLRQCNRESFYQRSLPLSTVLSIGTYYAIKTGYFRGHPRFGASPKVLIATAVGYFVGKFSYQSTCAEKLMQLPNSPIGEMLRQRKRQGGHQEMLVDHSNTSWPNVEPSNMESSLDLDSDRPMLDGLDDTMRPSLDSPLVEEDNLPSTMQQSTTYEELRKKYREEYEQRRSKLMYRGSSSTPDDLSVPVSPSRPEREQPPGWSQKAKNKYGDVWED